MGWLAVVVVLGCLGLGGILSLAGRTRAGVFLLWTGLGVGAILSAYLIADALTATQ